MESSEDLKNLAIAIRDGVIPNHVNIEEIDIFQLLDSDILKAVPGINKIVLAYKGFLNIRDKIFTKKFLIFLKEFRDKTINPDKFQKFQRKFDSDDNFRRKIIENLIVYIDDYKTYEKIKILARLFGAYIEHHFDWDHFLNLANCLDKVNLSNLIIIPKIDTTEGKEIIDFNEADLQGESDLISAGLAIQMSVWSSDIYPTNLGKDIYKFGYKDYM